MDCPWPFSPSRPASGEVCCGGMRSRILLVSANRCTAPDPVFPLGLAHLSAALRAEGHECLWLDSLAARDVWNEVLTHTQPDYVGISIRNIDDVLIRKKEVFFADLPGLVTEFRARWGCPIILGGSGFSIFPERLLELTGADFGIAGEGERSLPALIRALESGNDYQNIPGLVYRLGKRLLANPKGHDASEAPLEESDLPGRIVDYYRRTGSMLNLQTQRGCSFRCCYCTYPVIEGRERRRRSPEAVAEEFAQIARLGARYAFIVDSVFNSSAEHVAEICEALLRRNLQLPWGCFLRPQGLTAALLRLMARAGLAHIEFGSDSFCDEVLAAYHKDFTFEDILNASELARHEKIDFCHFLIAGGPGETQVTLERGFENSKQLRSAVNMAVVGMRIYPRTALYHLALAEGRLNTGTDLLSPVYYLAPGLTAENVFEKLQHFAQRAPNWIVGDPDPAYEKLVSRLRSRGVAGPLWSYFSMIQQLRPQAWIEGQP